MPRRLTSFEKKVYAAVMDIPIGSVRSYAWVARRIKRPGSARAVGNALHKNPLAPFVPCHRVVASDGTLGGYSGGLKKKKALLLKEAAKSQAQNPKHKTQNKLNIKNSKH